MFCKKKATLLVAILCVFAVSFVACSKKDAVSSGAATGADGATSQEVTKADKKAEEKKAKAEAKKAKESKKGSSEVKLPTTPNAEEDFIVELTKDGTGARVTGYKGKSGGVYIPATIQGLPVKEVEFDVVSDEFVLVNALVIPDGCTSVTIKNSRNKGEVRENEKGEAGLYENVYSNGGWKYVKLDTEFLGITLLSLPDSVTEFSGLEETYITEFEVPANVQVFNNTLPSTLEKVSFRGVPREIRRGFAGTKITEIVIPEGVKVLGGFAECQNLKTITLPDSIEVLYRDAFDHCTALEVVNLPANLKYIYAGTWTYGEVHGCFTNCSSLKELKIPESLTQISFCYTKEKADGSLVPSNSYEGYQDCDSHFRGCSSLPLATQARLKQLGYEGSF